MNPLTFRPEQDRRHAGDPDISVDWADNALSNAMAWSSHAFAPFWCQTEAHWTSRATDHVFTDCPCCLFFRGCLIGSAITTVAWASIFFIARAVLR